MSDHFFSQNCCTLSDEEVKDFVRKYQAGDREAAVPLIQSQAAWVMKLVKTRTIPSRVSVEDVYSELMLAFLHGLTYYDPSRSALSTFFKMIVTSRISDIIRRLGDQAQTSENSEFNGVAEEDYTTMNAEDSETIALICDIMHTHLTAFERDVFINYTDYVSNAVVAERANEFIRERNPEATSGFVFDERSIKPQIDRIIKIIRGELTRRGDIESSTSVQSRLF
jgi:RNA polymerase sigma factor (sigma-70 family)